MTDYFALACGLSLQADPLTVLLAKYVPDPDRRPRRDVSGDYSQSDFQILMVGSFSGTFRMRMKNLRSCSSMKDDQQLEGSR